jgi:hypothetical protein
MTLKDYIKGERRGKEANKLERNALNDPFLQDAIDGFDTVSGNHAEIIDKLEKRVTYIYNTRKKQRNWLYFGSIAASILILIGFSYYFLFVNTPNNSPLIAENNSKDVINHVSTEQPEMYIEDADALDVIDIQHEAPRIAPVKTVAECRDVVAYDAVASLELSDECKVSESFAMIADEKQIAMISKEEEDIVSEKIADESVVMIDNTRSKEVSKQETSAKAQKSAFSYLPFGEKEFKEYFLKNADKNVCAGKGAKVTVTFFINDAGKPEDLKFNSYSCDEAKKEFEKLLNSSPVWTGKNRKVGMTIEW